MIAVARIDAWPNDLTPLAAEAAGLSHATGLAAEWTAGAFASPGALHVAHLRGVACGFGGLTLDPTDATPGSLRLRRFFVSPARRRAGVGTALAEAVIEDARPRARMLVLRAGTSEAAAFWETLGFRRVDHPDRTHVLALVRP